MNTSKHSSSRGISLIEVAILLPVLAVILVGILQYGLLFAGYLTLHNAAVSCVRFAALNNQDASPAELAVVARESIEPLLKPMHLRAPRVDMNAAVAGIARARRVELTYDMPLLVPFLVPQAGGQTVFPIRAAAMMR